MNMAEALAVMIAAFKPTPLAWRKGNRGNLYAFAPDNEMYEVAVTDDLEAFCVTQLPSDQKPFPAVFLNVHEAKSFCQGIEARRQHERSTDEIRN